MDQTKDLFNDNKIPHKIINKCEKLIIYKKKTNTSNILLISLLFQQENLICI